ncbi:MAG: hypothetical protein KBA61_10650, partial [Spirochaetes bacterium]|nr:hypothetical protein [Spirochaetota bacterium]
IRQLHLHDNDGSGDEHLPIGAGNVDFGLVAGFIARAKVKPLVTLEPHSEGDIWKTLHGFHEKGLDRAL